jgi:hypothetical protein
MMMRSTHAWLAAAVLAGCLPAQIFAQRNAATAQSCVRAAPAVTQTAGRVPAPPPELQAWDVVVNVPNLCVDRLTLEVNDLQAHLALQAAVANLVNVHAGADVSVADVSLTIRGVHAQALLLVDLDNVSAVIDRTLTFVDNHPEIVDQLAGTLQNTVGTVGSVANTALQPGGVVDRTVGVVGQTLGNLTQPGGVLSQTVNALGQTVQTTLDQGGRLVERTLDTAGGVVSTRTLESLTSLPVLRQTAGSAGQVLRTVRTASGSVIEYTVNQGGQVLNARVVQQAGASTGVRP